MVLGVAALCLHRAIKRIVRPMMGYKSFGFAHSLIAGIETMHMSKKGQLNCPKARASSAVPSSVFQTDFCLNREST
jgi:hypothetical protein